MRDKVEALLFAAGRFLDEDQIAKLLQADVRLVRKALRELAEYYEKQGAQSALQVVEEGKSWKLHVKDAYLEIVSKLVSDKEIATTVLETLAIIAWKNPAMQAELIKIRGPAAYEHVGELIERGFVTKEPEGRTFKLRVTDKFFEYFDVEGRDDLQKLFKDVEGRASEDQAEIDQKQAAYEAQKTAAQRAREAVGEGSELEATEPAKLENSVPTASAHSAKDQLVSMLEEIKNEASKLDQTTPAAASATLAELKADVDAFGEGVQRLKEEEIEGPTRVPIRKPKPRPKHKAGKKKK